MLALIGHVKHQKVEMPKPTVWYEFCIQNKHNKLSHKLLPHYQKIVPYSLRAINYTRFTVLEGIHNVEQFADKADCTGRD